MIGKTLAAGSYFCFEDSVGTYELHMRMMRSWQLFVFQCLSVTSVKEEAAIKQI